MKTDTLVEEYRKTRPKSEELHKRALKAFAADGATHRARILDPYQPYITHALGSKKWDVDGIEYIDYVLGHSALLLGHSHPAVVKAIQEQAAKGLHYGANHELEIQWAELIQSMMPSAERVEFFACGQEANMMAIRLARHFTGRRKILRIAENFHGWADELVLSPRSPDVVADSVKILPLPYDLNRLEEELATREYAIFFIEGGGAHMAGQIPMDFDFVRALPDLTRKYGTLWNMDEVVTGFRDVPGGFQALVGVKPDLTSLGKIIGGGLGAGALVGRADIFEALSTNIPKELRAEHTGTWNGNPLTSAAGIACLSLCQSGELQKKVNKMSAYLREKGNQVFKEKGVSGRLYGRSITHIYLGPFDFEPTDEAFPPTKDHEKIMSPADTKVRLGLHLLHRGIASQSGRLFNMSSAHTEEDIDKTVEALADSLEAMIAEGTLPTREEVNPT
jgi:glutamate-1-semialdehyde 2,1-aminomutase